MNAKVELVKRVIASHVLAGALLLVAAGCNESQSNSQRSSRVNSQEVTNGITTKVLERDRDKDGKPDSRVEHYFRNGQTVMVVMSKVDAKANWLVTSRAFHVGDKMVSIEGDENGDGVFEALIFYRTDTDDMEVFSREANGSVRPASTQIMEAHKKQSAAIAEFFEEMADKDRTPTNLDAQIIEERIRATPKKIQEAQKEITEDR